jgi:glycine/D-amino acid oxidase-like deaminating enzyme
MAERRAVCIGGGITGVLTARELLLAGWDVTVLETRHVGAGSSSRTAAGIRQQFSTPETVYGMRFAVAFYRAFTEETEDRTCPIVQNGYLFLYDDPEAWHGARSVVEMQHRCGLIEVEALGADQLARRFPWVAADRLVGGTFCPTDGFLLPHVVYNEGARRVRALGGTLVQGAEVRRAIGTGANIQAVETTKGIFEADVFVDCTNAWTRRTGAALGAEPLDVDPLKRYLWFLRRDGSLGPDQLADMPLVIGPTGVYCRPENRDTLLVGKKHDTRADLEFTYDDQDVVEPGFAHSGGVDSVPFSIWAELAEVLPPVGEFAGFSSTTCGYYGTTPDHNPFFGYDRFRPNLIRLVGFSGHGAMFGPFTARIGRELAEAGRDLEAIELDGHRIALDAFRIGRTYTHAEKMVI